jgi:hypothetical protein
VWLVGTVHAGDLSKPGAVYIGRGGKGLAASPLANPFRLDPARPRDEQPDVLERYRRWLWAELQTDSPVRREIERLASLPDATLVCFCRPVGRNAPACHGDIIAKAIEWYRTNNPDPI